MSRRDVCPCELYETCPQCRGTDRDMGRFLELEEQRVMQTALRRSVRKVGRGKHLQKSEANR